MVETLNLGMSVQQQPQEEIIIFTRYPTPGKVKTRLIPKLGGQKAAHIHRLLTEQIIRSLLPLQQSRPVHVFLYYTGGSQKMMKNWLGGSLFLAEQKGKNLGQRMASAFKAAWARGTERAVIIGSDCPFITDELLARALDLLGHNDAVLGPAYDGGYYLLGLNRGLPVAKFDLFFEDIAWGTPLVFQQTLERAENVHLSVSTLTRLHDIDRPEDLEYFRHHTNAQ